MNNTLQCQCGAIQGYADLRHLYARARCYCADCQAFARFLGRQDEILDRHGGTEILAMHPTAVHFTAGEDKIACMSLSSKGLLRWYASCCRTPIGNTPRDSRTAYVGLIRACLPTPDESLGPVKIALNTQSAKGRVRATPFAALVGVVRIMSHVIRARLGRTYKSNPFFEPDSRAPIRTPQVLTRTQRKAIRKAG